MNNFITIQQKLEQFIKRYYLNELIKGIILFFTLGMLYFIATLLIEHFLWLSSSGRTFLFWLFIFFEALLFLKYIVLPLTKLFKLKNGLDHIEASKIIGNHFSAINDKLINVVQLSKNPVQSELLLASIEQKAKTLYPIPFKQAIDFKKNSRYLKYAAIPICIVLFSYISGKTNWFSSSYDRVVNYQTAFEPPAPFQFFVLNQYLNATEGQDFTVAVQTVGDLIPENVTIHYNNESYFLKQLKPGEFEYTFSQPKEKIQFNFLANSISSRPYELKIIEAPKLVAFDMKLDYPRYLNKISEKIKSTGNAVVPEGTRVTWLLKTKSTTNVNLYANDTTAFIQMEDNYFEASKRLFKTFNYSLNTSNNILKDYESLSFLISVVKDDFPLLDVKMKQDSTDAESLHFYGQASDDHGISKLQLVYYPSENENNKQQKTLSINKSNITEFFLSFPYDLRLEEGRAYKLYFEAFDNDALHQYKSVKSNTFNYRKLTEDELENKKLQNQNETIEDLSKSLKTLNKQKNELEELSKIQKEKSQLNFNDKKKLKSFLKRQKQQDQLIKNFNKELKDNLEEYQNIEDKQDQFKEDVKERLEENQEQLKKDDELLKELEKLADKINKEELTKKLEQLAKQNKNKQRSLEQLLELTKRYYVSKKAEKLKKELEELSKEQEKQSNEELEKNTKEKQDELNTKFNDFLEELNKLKKDNKALKKPMDVLPNDKKAEESIKKEQQQASENLEIKENSQSQDLKKLNQEKAKKNQKKAAQKMKHMSEQMQQMMMAGSGGLEQLTEDIDTLRQILDNLLLFSFDQEKLMKIFSNLEVNHNEYAKYLRQQKILREHFEHIDDSIFALSLRQPAISEKVNYEIAEAFFNIDKAMEFLAENRLYQGVAKQQYTVTSANALADLLSDTLDGMQAQLQMSGQGEGGDSQLPDIIMSQEELNKKMQEGINKSDKTKGDKKGDKKGEKDAGKEGEKGNNESKNKSEGNQGQDGQKQSYGDKSDEMLKGELYEIFQRQQQLREALQNRIAKDGLKGNADNLAKKMEEIELDLINKGFTNETLKKMTELKHQLLKLENATFQQGEDNKRKSTSNIKNYNNNTDVTHDKAKQYFNTTEILNRQGLPLRQAYKNIVHKYFKKQND